jgi:hypothetical protein
VTVVNRRKATPRRFADVTFALQVRLEVRCATGFFPRSDMTGFGSRDPDAALADLHYAGVAERAIGCNASAGWTFDADSVVRSAYTDFLPTAEVERVEPNKAIRGVEFEMEALAALAADRELALFADESVSEIPEYSAGWRHPQPKPASVRQFRGTPLGRAQSLDLFVGERHRVGPAPACWP